MSTNPDGSLSGGLAIVLAGFQWQGFRTSKHTGPVMQPCHGTASGGPDAYPEGKAKFWDQHLLKTSLRWEIGEKKFFLMTEEKNHLIRCSQWEQA